MNNLIEATADFKVCHAALRSGDWTACIAAYDTALAAGAIPDAAAQVALAIAHIRVASDPTAVIARLDARCLAASGMQAQLRRLVISPLVRDGALAAAVAVLLVALAAWPDSIDDRRLLASVLGRLKRWPDAILHADLAASAAPADHGVQAARMQLRLQAGMLDDAADIARATAALVCDGNDSAHIWLIALARGGATALAAQLAAGLDPARYANERVAASALHALLDDHRIQATIDAGERALQLRLDGPALRCQLGQAYLARGSEQDRTVSALTQFALGRALAPDDLRLASLHGETLLGAGRYADAIAPLQRACELAPALAHPRATLARALRFCGRYEEAADTLLAMGKLNPDALRWQRGAIAALSQCGRAEEAIVMHTAYIARRAAALPANFDEALATLEHTLDRAPIPQARLDWAWSLRREDTDIDRAAWERAARWGHQIDHLFLEWLECREERAEEAMAMLGDLGDAERFFAPLMANRKGVVVATAHVGPMYAGLMALELLGIPSRWLSSTPGVSQVSYAAALISTADQTQAQVAKESLRALQAGFAVCIAVDGAPNPSAPRIDFEGQTITFSSFAARAAHRLKLPSVFYAPSWVDSKVIQSLTMLPDVRDGEDVEAYVVRWQDAYLSLLREHIGGAPENLRLSGGLWRHVRAADRAPLAALSASVSPQPPSSI